VSARRAAKPPVAAWGAGLFETLDDMDVLEREALARDDWTRLEEVLDQQTTLWQRLASLAHDNDEATRITALAGLRRLYEIRARNHGLIEQRTAELRQELAAAQQGSAAQRAYADLERRAA